MTGGARFALFFWIASAINRLAMTDFLFKDSLNRLAMTKCVVIRQIARNLQYLAQI
ncbi:hypothetical protein [Helicobacter sp. 23-1045]